MSAPETDPPISSSEILSRETRRALEVDSCLAVIAELAATDLGRAKLLDLTPSSDSRELEERQEIQREVARLAKGGRLVASFDEPIAPLLVLLEAGADFTGKQLLALGRVISAAVQAVGRTLEDPEQTPGLAHRSQAVRGRGDLAPFASRIEQILDPSGNVRDDASPRLSSLRNKIKSRRDGLYKELSGYLQEHQTVLADETVSMRDGRLTVLLPAGGRGKLPGLTHGRSATGRSFYFEPLQVVDSNNELQQAIEDESLERHRLLRELSTTAKDQSQAIVAHAEYLADLDCLVAGYRFGDITEGQLLEPNNGSGLRLVAARHPLLDPRLKSHREWALGQSGQTGEIVPLTLELGSSSHPADETSGQAEPQEDENVLVVTGPNAGGKTVALKCVGLLAMLHQCGLPVPAGTGSWLPTFSSIVAVVGDDQDLLMDRSTFSGRLLRLQEAWLAAGPHSLVLLDEVGAGTNPEEGAALSVALLEALVEKGALAILVTHLTQLASAAMELERAGCAAMEFDPTLHQPTFRLRRGGPGGSEALSLAQRLGLPSDWLARANELLSDEHRSLRGLLREAELARDQLRAREQELERIAADQKTLERRAAEELEALTRERQALKKRFRAQFETFQRQVRSELDVEAKRIKKEVEAGKRKNLSSAAVSRLFEEAPEEITQPAVPESEVGAPGDFAVGDSVRHLSFGWQGVVQSIEKKRVTVDARGKTFRCATNELARLLDPPRDARPKRRRDSKSTARVETTDVARSALELNLVGQRVEPALDQLDTYLDRALLSDAERVRVIHGHGTGRLRAAVREHLRKHAAVTSFTAGDQSEGGDGATLVVLRR